jgi:hypothetical protein
VVWLPEHRVALVSNLFGPLFPHFPNLNTIRGDKYRFVEPTSPPTAWCASCDPRCWSPVATSRSSAPS